MRPASVALQSNGKIVKRLGPSRKKSVVFVEKKSDDIKHRMEWCAEADRYRCARCGRGSKNMKMPERCTGPKFLSKS